MVQLIFSFYFGKYEPICHPLMVDMKDIRFLLMLDALILASSANLCHGGGIFATKRCSN